MSQGSGSTSEVIAGFASAEVDTKAMEVERRRPTIRDPNFVGRSTRTELKNHCWTPAWNQDSETSVEPGP